MFRVLAAVGLAFGGIVSLEADDPNPAALPLSVLAEHRHEAIELESAPIINRIPVAVHKIRRVFRESSGSFLLTEWETGTVLRVLPNNEVRRIAAGLNQPSDIAQDAAGYIYVSQYADGIDAEGSVVKIGPTGDVEVVAKGLTGPTALEVDNRDNLIVTEYQAGRILSIAPDGMQSELARGIDAPSALAVDAAGIVYVTSSTRGVLYQLDRDGLAAPLVTDLKTPSDVQFDGGHLLVITNYGDGSLTAWDLAEKREFAFGAVPQGTIAACFCERDNFLIAHFDYSFLMKITRTLMLKCPHCGQPIPVKLVPRRPPDENGSYEF